MVSSQFLGGLSGYKVSTNTEILCFFFPPEAGELKFSSVGSFLLFCLFDDGNKVHFVVHGEGEFHVY